MKTAIPKPAAAAKRRFNLSMTAPERWHLTAVDDAGQAGFLALGGPSSEQRIRLNVLSGLGMVEKMAGPSPGGFSRYEVTPKGWKALREPWDDGDCDEGRYYAVIGGDTGQEVLASGTGASEEAAWRDAAERGRTRESLEAEGFRAVVIDAGTHAELFDGYPNAVVTGFFAVVLGEKSAVVTGHGETVAAAWACAADRLRSTRRALEDAGFYVASLPPETYREACCNGSASVDAPERIKNAQP